MAVLRFTADHWNRDRSSTVLLPSPSRLGFPDSIASWRRDQQRAIHWLIDSETRFDGLMLPTGAGKTNTYLGFAQMQPRGERALVLTATKALEDQIVREASAAGSSLSLADVRGKSNYRCVAASSGGELADAHAHGTDVDDDAQADSRVSVEHGPCFAGASCSLVERGCTYFDALRKLRDSRIAVTNYDKWIATPDHREVFGNFTTLILDEASLAEGKLTGALRIDLERAQMERHVRNVPWPGDAGRVDATALVFWARKYKLAAEQAARGAEARAKELISSTGMSAKSRESAKSARVRREIAGSVASLASLRGEWVVDELERTRAHGISVTPVWPAPYAPGMLFRSIPKVVLTGASVREKTLDILGVPRAERSFVEYPSSFAVMNRPVVYVRSTPRLALNAAAERDEAVVARLVSLIDRLLDTLNDRAGIIHAGSYRRARYILQRSRHKMRMITHAEDSEATRAAVARYKEAARRGEPVVLLSPSVSTGWDFPGVEAEYAIIAKVPFVDMRSRVMKRRIEIDASYGDYLCAQELVQMAGRIVRGSWDRGATYVLDAQFEWFPWKGANRELFPRYFLEAIRTHDLERDGEIRPLAKLAA